jgi:5-methylcytosine-specific restriction endonuclease McrA
MTTTDPRYHTPEWTRLAQWVKDRDRGVCQVRDQGCTHAGTAVDHIVPVAEGGDFWDPTNLRASCRSCNSRRGARLANTRNARYRHSVAAYESRW